MDGGMERWGDVVRKGDSDAGRQAGRDRMKGGRKELKEGGSVGGGRQGGRGREPGRQGGRA